jgi:hypothetical protein
VYSRSHPHPASLNAIVERLVGAGIRAEAIAEAINLLRTGRADLIDDVIAGRLEVSRALKIARRGRP